MLDYLVRVINSPHYVDCARIMRGSETFWTEQAETQERYAHKWREAAADARRNRRTQAYLDCLGFARDCETSARSYRSDALRAAREASRLERRCIAWRVS